MATNEPIDGLSNDARDLLVQGLRALRLERGKAWNAACDAAAAGKRQPSLRPFGIEEIRRLTRGLGDKATHWTEEG